VEQIIQIVTDSSCDLPQRLLERFKIAVVPLIVRFGSEVYEDGELSVGEFWRKAAGPHHPQTSQPSVGKFEELFERLVAQGKQVLCLTITGKHSGTFNAASLAAQRFGEAVNVFDSLSLSLGLGVQALVAAQTAQAGRSMQEILALLEDLRARIRVMIVLDTLENLAHQLEDLNVAAGSLGCALTDPFMALSFLALPVIPELKLTDMGLVDVRRFARVPLFPDHGEALP